MDFPFFAVSDSKRFEKALHGEDNYMPACDLPADNYWTESITILVESMMPFLRRNMLEVVPDVGWIDGQKVSTFPFTM